MSPNLQITKSPPAAARATAPPRQSAVHRSSVVVLCVLTAIAFALRATGIDQTLFEDEYFTHRIVAHRGLGSVWHEVFYTSITPPLHYVLAWMAVQFGGDSTILLRIPSLVLGTALVPLVFFLARRIGNNRVALLAAALMTLSPFAIWYSDEGRAYTTMMFFTAVSTLALLRGLDGAGRRWWVLFAVASCAALWTHYTAVFVIVAQAVWAFWSHPDHRRQLLLAVAAVLVGYMPWLPGFLQQRKNHGIEAVNGFSHISFGSVFKLPLQTAVGHPDLGLSVFPGAWGLVVASTVAILAVAAMVRPTTMRPLPTPRHLLVWLTSERALVTILALATPIGLLLYAVSGTKLWLPRNLSASLPTLVALIAFLFVALTAGVSKRLAAPAIGVIVAALFVNAINSLRDNYLRPSYRDAAHYIDHAAGAGDAVIETPLVVTSNALFPKTTLDFYFQRKHALYPAGAGDGAAWAQLHKGRDVFAVSPATGFLAPASVTHRRGGEDPAPPAMAHRIGELGGLDGRALVRSIRTYAGLVPVAVVRYAGVVDGRLIRSRGQAIISWSLGNHVTITPGVARGSVDIITRSKMPLLVGGWAIDTSRRLPADWLLAFSGNRLLAVSALGGRRPDVAKAYGKSALLSGFGFLSPDAPPDHSTVRLFAVVGDRASELPIGVALRRQVSFSAAAQAIFGAPGSQR